MTNQTAQYERMKRNLRYEAVKEEIKRRKRWEIVSDGMMVNLLQQMGPQGIVSMLNGPMPQC